MKCPECGNENNKRARLCASCGYELREARVSFLSGFFSRSRFHRGLGVALIVLTCVAGAIVIGLGIYRIYFWSQAKVTARLYESGYYRAAEVEAVTLDNMQVGHVITFFGQDGDSIFINELRRSYVISGGLVKIELPDSSWFDVDPEDVEAVNVTLSPVLTTKNNEKRLLPEVQFTIDVPESPIELINPPTERETVLTSIYKLQFRVVNGSTVLIGGRDHSDLPNEEGILSANVNVYPQGDNLVSILVKTPHHKEKRVDLVLYRAVQEIELEPNLDIPQSTNQKNLKISGKIAPGATLSVDTPHLEETVTIDMLNGTFSFNTDFDTIGDNTVTFRAQMEGKKDSVISLNVYYVPPLNRYDDNVWAMDYDGLTMMGDLWEGKKFLCQGEIVAIIDGDPEILIMNVAGEGKEEQLVALDNRSAVEDAAPGQKYRAFADVVDRYFYNNKNIPHLVARYMLVD